MRHSPVDISTGKYVSEVVPDYAEKIKPFYDVVLETGKTVENVELQMVAPGPLGEQRDFVVNYFPVLHGDNVRGVGFVAIDLTDRKRAEQQRQEQITTAETLHEIGQSLTSELAVDQIVQTVTDAASSLTGAQFGPFFTT